MFSVAGNFALTHGLLKQQRLCDAMTQQTLSERNCYMWSRYAWECKVADATGVERPTAPPPPRPSDAELYKYDHANPTAS